MNAHGADHVHANMSVCFKEKWLFFFSVAWFRLGSSQLEWKKGSNGWETSPAPCYKKEQAYCIWRIFLLLSYNSTDFCSSMRYHLSPFPLSSGYRIWLSISTHTPLRRQALLKGFFWPGRRLKLEEKTTAFRTSGFPNTEFQLNPSWEFYSDRSGAGTLQLAPPSKKRLQESFIFSKHLSQRCQLIDVVYLSDIASVFLSRVELELRWMFIL